MFLIRLLLLCCSGVGLPAGVLRLCGVFLYSSGAKSGDPPAHGLLAEPNHTQHDCGNWFFITFSTTDNPHAHTNFIAGLNISSCAAGSHVSMIKRHRLPMVDGHRGAAISNQE